MNDIISERILIKMMNWDHKRVSEERSNLEIMARYKYDSYKGFSPGMRFLESLVLWLQQFETLDERNAAFDFLKRRLIFCSHPEMEQLVSMTFQDCIKPMLLEQVAKVKGYPEYYAPKLSKSIEFSTLLRRSLFLGLSDGARLDIFRRSNRKYISHEQIYPLYDISDTKSGDFIDKLRKDLKEKIGKDPEENVCNFKNLFLLDDFTGSGKTYLRKKNGGFEGKLFKLFERITTDTNPLSQMLDKDLMIYIIIYIATADAIAHLSSLAKELFNNTEYECKLRCIQYLSNDIKVDAKETEFIKLIDKYYDPKLETTATKVGGGGDIKLGFSNSALPLILDHNTPNNSIALLWSEEHLKVRGLFPRISRH